jgi:hypothetical protein
MIMLGDAAQSMHGLRFIVITQRNIANRDDTDKIAVLDNRKAPNLISCHSLRHTFNRSVRRDRLKMGRHQLCNRRCIAGSVV